MSHRISRAGARPILPTIGALLLLASPCAEAGRQLSFLERVAAQEAIERVYYAHQIDAALPFEEAVPRSVLERKVEGYLRRSAALERFWHTPVTEAALERELQRIARQTRFPDRLLEIYDALGKDPLLIRECFARPVLVDRLARNWFAYDERFHGASRGKAESLRQELASGAIDPREEHPRRRRLKIELRPDGSVGPRVEHPAPGHEPVWRVDAATFARLRDAASTRAGEPGQVREERDRFTLQVALAGDDTRLDLVTYTVPKRTWDSWWRDAREDLRDVAVPTVAAAEGSLPLPGETTSTVEMLMTDPCDLDDTWEKSLSWQFIPSARWLHTIVWTGSLMVVWGGTDSFPSAELDTGARYDPITDQWTPTSTTNAPAGRWGHTAVWTGTEMIVWGGNLDTTGGRYDPLSDAWSPTSTVATPTARINHAAVWAGDRMIVWGGWNLATLNTGASYDPATDSWTPTATAGAPEARDNHMAASAGNIMFVWGGLNNSDQLLNTGGRYDPATDSWSPTSTVGAPTPRLGASALWTGSEVIVWGGGDNTGGRYNPVADSWVPTSTAGAPIGVVARSAVWTGSEMVVWGGPETMSGGRYDPAADSWTPTSTVSAPSSRTDHRAVWTGSLVIVWGGRTTSPERPLNTGGRYDPSTDSWTPTVSGTVPSPRAGHSAFWTGNQLVIWGGSGVVLPPPVTGARYDPLSDAWSETSTTGAPGGRYYHAAAWSGNEMLVWGGYDGDVFGDGARYDPISDAWSPIATTGAPVGRYQHTAVWTGSELIVWGGKDLTFNRVQSGGRYDPVSDSWLATSTVGAPSARQEHVAVWADGVMIIWGGRDSQATITGGRYDPVADSWTPTAVVSAPQGRTRHTVVWTGDEMIVWGGWDTLATNLGSGGRYDPAADVWTPTSPVGAPTARNSHAAAWTGGVMLIWGGYDGQDTADGGRYDPSEDTWTQISTIGAPAPRSFHSATGADDLLMVWGGLAAGQHLDSGGLYRSVIAPETCDGLDNDCDGTIDALPTSCGLGECASVGMCFDGVDDCSPGIPSPEACDGLDNDCDGFVPVDEVDDDADGARVCDGDCDDGDPTVFAGAPEINDGIDNQCAGDPGYGVIDEISGTAGFLDPLDATQFCWPAQAGATMYEVARSELPDHATDCVRFTTTETCWSDPEVPAPGVARHYLVRTTAPAIGSWGVDGAGAERVGVCGVEDCGDGVDNDGDGLLDCEDLADCYRVGGCNAAVYSFVDGTGDDVAATSLQTFFASLALQSTDYIRFAVTIPPNPPDFEWCAERADAYRDDYLALAATGGETPAGSWSVWYQAMGSGWNGPLVDTYVNYYGDRCFGPQSWCSETGLGGRVLTVDPASVVGSCEARDAFLGCGTTGEVLSITVGTDRLSACGF